MKIEKSIRLKLLKWKNNQQMNETTKEKIKEKRKERKWRRN